MEDSEQRKKRLKEMRMQADLAEVSGSVEGSGIPGLLSNPLIEASSSTPSQDKSYAAPRFDYYTDPMNAFSSNKRNTTHIQSAPDYFPPPNFASSPVARFSSPHPESTNPHMSPSPTQVSPAPYRNPVWNGPRGPPHYNSPFRPAGGGTYPGPRFEPLGAPLYNSGGGTYPSPRFEPSGGPLYNSGGGTYPSPRFEPSGAPLYNSGGSTYPSPRFEPSGTPLYNSGQGIIHRPCHSPNPPGYRNSPGPSRGRGRGFLHNTRSPVSGRGTGRGPSSYGYRSNEDRASGQDRFYKMSMVEDPWRLLKPVIWKATDAPLYTPGTSKPWTSKSVSTKSEELPVASVKPGPEPSLAEYLAAAFNEAANDEENV